MRDRLNAIKRTLKSRKSSSPGTTLKTCSLAREDDRICFNVLRINGRLSSETYFTELDETFENTCAEMLKLLYRSRRHPVKIILDGPARETSSSSSG